MRIGRIDSGSYRAAVAEPYAMAYAHAWPTDGLYVVMRGGGGGAAQMMPASVLGPVCDAARSIAIGAHDGERLTRWIAEVDARISALRAGPMYAGSHAEATALTVSGDRAWVGNVGLGRCYLLGGSGLVQLTRDDSLLREAHDAGHDELDGWYQDVATLALGAWQETRRDWWPIPISLEGATGFVLATCEAHRAATADDLASWSRDAFATSDLDDAAAVLWHRLRANLTTASTLVRAEFERRAAVMLLRVR